MDYLLFRVQLSSLDSRMQTHIPAAGMLPACRSHLSLRCHFPPLHRSLTLDLVTQTKTRRTTTRRRYEPLENNRRTLVSPIRLLLLLPHHLTLVAVMESN